jgi:hypothetical protein
VELGLVVLVAAVGIAIARMIYVETSGHDARVKRRLALRARVTIAQAQEGLVRLIGRVHLTGVGLTAPVSGRPCVAYRLIVKVMDDNDRWREVLELEDACPFVLADETGQAVIDAEAGPLWLSLVPDRGDASTGSGRESADLTTVRELLNSDDIEPRGAAPRMIFGERERVYFSEAVLLPGNQVAVGGPCAREIALDGERAGYREVPRRLVVRGAGEEPLLISNWPYSIEEQD